MAEVGDLGEGVLAPEAATQCLVDGLSTTELRERETKLFEALIETCKTGNPEAIKCVAAALQAVSDALTLPR